MAIARIAVPILVVNKRPNARYGDALIAFDHTLGSRQALELVTKIAPSANFTIARVTDVDINQPKELENTADMISGHVETILRKMPDSLSRGHDTTVMIKTGNVGDELLDCCAVKPDILAFGRTRKTGLKSLVPGSTAKLLI